MFMKSAVIMAVLVAMVSNPAAFAATAETGEVSALSGVTVTVADAVAAVEAKNGGKVVELTLSGTADAPIYDLTAQMPDGTESNFTVDAKTGVVATSADVADNQGGGARQGEPEAGSDGGESGEGSN